MKDFSEVDKSIMKNLMLSKSYKDIASIMDCEIDDVKSFVEETISGTLIVAYQMRLDDKKRISKAIKVSSIKKIERPPKYAIDIVKKKSAVALEREKRKEKYQIKVEANNKRWEGKRNRSARNTSQFSTKIVNYELKQKVVIDKRTTIYIGMDEDPEQAKHKYFKNIKIKKQQNEH